MSDILESLEIIMVTGTLILVGYTAIQITKGSKTNMKIVIGAVILSIPPLISIRGRYPPPYTYWSIDYAFKIGFYLYLLGLLLIIIGGWRGSQLNSFNDD